MHNSKLDALDTHWYCFVRLSTCRFAYLKSQLAVFILSKLCFASDITDGSFHFEIIMAMYNSIVTICLATVLGSLFTIVLLNYLPRHIRRIWSSSVLAIFFIFRTWANDLTLFLPQVVSRIQTFTFGRFSDSKHAGLISQGLIAANSCRAVLTAP